MLSTVAYRGQEVTAPRLRGLLALLAQELGAGCSVQRLVEGLWREEQPENPAKAVRVLISRVRTQLGTDLIASTPTGYKLALEEHEVDATAIQQKAAAAAKAARTGDHEEALAQAEAGLALWNGAGAGEENPVEELRKSRIPTWRALTRARALALARLGRHAEALDPLKEQFGNRPKDEELLAELLRAEAATTGPAEALSRYDKYRRELRDELGTDPGPALKAAHQELLHGGQARGVLHEPNPLLGREKDLAAVTKMLATARVTSIVGPGGLGKTRLAHAISREVKQRNVYFVPLAVISKDEHVINEVAAVLGVREPRQEKLVAAIRNIPALIVLDNCEHVVNGAAALAQALVSMTDDLRILTTSRAPLGLSSESVYTLGELPLETAVDLFGQRAKAARPGVDLPPDKVAEVCGHLDGLPLAIELAAARVRVMSIADIAERLHDRFALLRGGSRDAPERHQTLHAVVEWSWNLLSSQGRQAMATLSIFPAGFTGEAAEHLLGKDALRTLEHLADQSLLKVTDTPAGTRFQMLETVREFSEAHRDHDHTVTLFLAWARDFGLANYELIFGTDPLPSAQRTIADQDNLVQALRYAIDRRDSDTVASAAAVLTGIWLLLSSHSRIADLADDIAWVLVHVPPTPAYIEAARMAAAVCGVMTFMVQGPRAVRSLVVLRRLPPAAPDTPLKAAALLLTTLAERPGMSTVYELADSPEPSVSMLANLVASYSHESDLDPHAALEAARRVEQRLDDSSSLWFTHWIQIRIAELSLQVGEPEEAQRRLRAALGVIEPDVTGVRLALVMAHLHVGDLQAAEQWLAQAEEKTYDATVDVTFRQGVQAEIQLARGEIESGLRTWRLALAAINPAQGTEYRVEPSGMDPWLCEIQAVTVIAHAHHDRLELVADLVAELPARLAWLLRNPAENPSPTLMATPVWGALLLAIGMADRPRSVRLIALAERLRYVRTFQPTMSVQRMRECAEQADKLAYTAAVSEYASLNRDELRLAALVELDRADR